jgi:hypothetical protein
MREKKTWANVRRWKLRWWLNFPSFSFLSRVRACWDMWLLLLIYLNTCCLNWLKSTWDSSPLIHFHQTSFSHHFVSLFLFLASRASRIPHFCYTSDSLLKEFFKFPQEYFILFFQLLHFLTSHFLIILLISTSIYSSKFLIKFIYIWIF